MIDFDENDAFEEGAKLTLSQRAMATQSQSYMEGLNPAQRAAVEALDGPVLMLAGAGTGKTKALTTRIAHLLSTRRAMPNEILAVTFTNKAAREMKNRVGALVGPSADGIKWMGTFHAICVKLLRRHAELVGLKSNFTILDTDDQVRLLKQVINAANMDEKRWPARQLSHLIDAWKNRAWTPETVPTSESTAFNDRGIELYAAYQARLKTLNACDFGDLLLHCVTIFQKHDDILKNYQRWLKFILVDEYQDTNVAQYLWLRLLASGHKNICCVGDDDQSIYGWRGAEVGNILRFEKDFPGATVVKLEQNYRSTEHILAAASGVIAGNSDRLGKTLWTAEKGGEKVRLIGHRDGEEEARWLGDEVEALQRGTRNIAPKSLEDIAILVRASHQMRAFEDRFLTIGMPYRVIGGPRFYERLEIRDAMAYFRCVVSPDDDLAFERIVNTPKRGLGDKAQQKIQMTARAHGVPLIEGARILLQDKGLTGKGAKELAKLVESLTQWRMQMTGVVPSDDDQVIDSGDLLLEPVPQITHIELAEVILEESGYTAMWMNDKTPEAPGRLENLKELVKALEQFENLQGFLEHVALIMDNESEESEEKVTIMTLHAAKGLEYPAVFLPGWEDGLFPSQRSMDESGVTGLEEERRLAYVGITRAEELCTISFTSSRLVYGQWQAQLPSRFIDELPEEHVEVVDNVGNMGGGFGAVGMSSFEQNVSKADVYNSPGWKRMEARGKSKARVAPRSKSTYIDATAVAKFTQGDRIFNQKFGYGIVIGVDGENLEVEFDKAGLKMVKAGFVTPAEKADDVPF